MPFALAILALVAWIFRPAGYFRPIDIPRDKVHLHSRADRPERLESLIRVAGVTVDHQYGNQNFEIEIDPLGRPVSEKFLTSTYPELVPPPEMIATAIAQIRTWKFVPFQVKGHSAYARFVAEFTLVPEQDRPSPHTNFPQVTDANKVLMTYKEVGIRRAPRLVTVRGDGQIDVVGYDGNGRELPAHVRIPKEAVLGLIDGFRRADFFSLQGYYGGGPSEGRIGPSRSRSMAKSKRSTIMKGNSEAFLTPSWKSRLRSNVLAASIPRLTRPPIRSICLFWFWMGSKAYSQSIS